MKLIADHVSIIKGSQRILCEICVSIEAAMVTVLIGPNGAGKSTLLKVLSGDIKPKHGEVRLDDTPLTMLSDADQAKTRSVMSQSTPIVFDFSVLEVLSMGWVQYHLWSQSVMQQAIHDTAVQCSIEHLLQRTFNTLSGGEQQRVQFARALLQIWQPLKQYESRFLLLDEPSSNLDLAHEQQLLRIARQQANRGVGVLIVLHDLSLAARFADKLILLSEGQVVATGLPSDVLDAQKLSEVYQTPLYVEQHKQRQRLLVFS